MEQRKVKPILLSKDLNEYISEQLNILYDDKLMANYLKELGISVDLVEKYLDIFMDIHDDLKYCQNCPGIAKCSKKNPTLLVRPIIREDRIDRKLAVCHLLEKKLICEKKFIVRDFKDSIIGKTIKNKSDLDITESRKASVTKFLSILEDNSSSWIYLYGSTKLGKSYMIALFIQTLLENNENATCAFLDSTSRIKELTDLSFTNKQMFNELLEEYMNVDYLVLDDFGNEYKNEYIRDNIIYPLLSYRSKENKPVYFTSHYSISEIVTLYGISASGKIRARQLGDLIKTMAIKEIHLEGVKVY